MKNSLRNIPSYFAATVLVVGTMAGVRAETVDSRIGSLSFERGLPTEDTVTKLFDTLDFQRACQAYIWALPLVGIGTFQRAHYQTFGASDGDIVIYQTYRDKLGILTPNATTPYIISFVNLARTGPVVIDLPAGPNASGVSDFWQHAVTDMGQTGPDKGAGGKYLVIGPGQTEPPNVEANSFDKRFAGSLYRPEAHWDYVIAVDWTAETEFYRQIDELSAYCYEASGTSKGMVTKTPGVGQAYLATYRDKDGHAFDGAKTYRCASRLTRRRRTSGP